MSYVVDAFEKMFGNQGLLSLVQNEQILAGLFFIAILFGTFSLFNAILQKVGTSLNIGGKPAKVISFIVSFMGTSGIFFIYKGDSSAIVTVFGGTAGFLIVLAISIFVMKFFYDLAGDKDENNKVLWWFWVSLGTFISSGFIVAYFKKLAEFSGYMENVNTFFAGVFEVATVALLVTGVLAVFGLFTSKAARKLAEDAAEREKEYLNNPELKNAKGAIKRIKGRVSKIDSLFKNINKYFERN